jgi:23S rRNA (uracil1939-C5)-methyltransferase
MSALVKGTIGNMAFGGDGILRAEGKVVFIPFTAPGDEVEATLSESKKSYARAKLTTLISPSKDRVEARCPHFGVCGGCQLQHLNYDAQLTIKQDFIVQALARMAKLSSEQVSPVIGADARWNYRRVVKMRFVCQEGLLTLGYVNADANDIFDVVRCPIFVDDEAFFVGLKAWLLASKATEGTLTLLRAGDCFVGWLETEQLPASLTLPPGFQGLLVTTKSGERALGDVRLTFSVGGSSFVFTPQTFVQNHPEQSAKIASALVETVVKGKAQRVLDLYCGLGVSAILLAQKAVEVTGVEGNPESIRLAKSNAAANHCEVKWVCDDVAHFLQDHKQHYDCIVVNPPRTGLSPRVISALVARPSQMLIYVSCMPQTLARDLKALAEGGYQLQSCQGYDMFPQTTHVETMVVLKHLRV